MLGATTYSEEKWSLKASVINKESESKNWDVFPYRETQDCLQLSLGLWKTGTNGNWIT
jgi:hypothetical protein